MIDKKKASSLRLLQARVEGLHVTDVIKTSYTDLILRSISVLLIKHTNNAEILKPVHISQNADITIMNTLQGLNFVMNVETHLKLPMI